MIFYVIPTYIIILLCGVGTAKTKVWRDGVSMSTNANIHVLWPLVSIILPVG